MSDKLKELTEKLYKEGLSKGREEGEKYLSDARKEAEEIVAKAKKEAEKIIGNAEKKAADIQKKAESDIKMASEQSLQATRKDIENLLVAQISTEKVDAALSDEKFLREIILKVAENFGTEEAKELKLILPETLQKKLEPWAGAELKKALGKEIKAEFSKKITGGFTIGPSDGSYFISLTDETFRELIGEYLRPVTRKIIFGE